MVVVASRPTSTVTGALDSGDGEKLTMTNGGLTSSMTSSTGIGDRPLREITDHLGLPLHDKFLQKFKYSRTYTVMYDQKKARDIKSERQWVMLKDTKVVMDFTMAGLTRLFELFNKTSRNAEIGLIGPRTFFNVMRQHGIRDPILINRLFKEFSEEPDRINYRDFMGVLCSVNEEPIEDRLGLLFDVWDVDRSNSLSYSELGSIMVQGVQSNELAQVTETFNKVWSEIRSNVQDTDQDGWGRANGLLKEDLTEAAKKPGFVRDFFMKLLTRQSPVGRDRDDFNFAARLREIEADILKESRQEEKRLMELKQQQAAEAAKKSPKGAKVSGVRIAPMSKSKSTGSLQAAKPGKLGATRQLSMVKRQAGDALTDRQIGTPSGAGATRLPPI